MRLPHSLVFLISTGKNHTLAFMSFALEWKKDHKRNSKTHCGEYLCTLFAFLYGMRVLCPRPAPDTLCYYSLASGRQAFPVQTLLNKMQIGAVKRISGS